MNLHSLLYSDHPPGQLDLNHSSITPNATGGALSSRIGSSRRGWRGLRWLAGAGVILALWGSSAAMAQQSEDVSNFIGGTFGADLFVGRQGTTTYAGAISFTTGTSGYTLGSVFFSVLGITGAPGALSVTLHSSTGVPGGRLAILTGTSPTAASNVTYTAPANTMLDPGTEYFVVLAASAAPNDARYNFATTIITTEAGDTGWSIGDQHYTSIAGINSGGWTATDNSLMFSVTANVVPAPPVFTSAASTATFEVDENTVAVGMTGHFAATDINSRDTVTYSLSGADAALFRISSSGGLSFRDAPDFDRPPAGGDNDYTVVVTATSGTDAMTVEATVTARVINVLEPPVAPAAVRVSALSHTSLRVDWDPAIAGAGPDITSYDIGYRINVAGSAFGSANIASDGEFAAIISGLTADTSYEVRVRAADAGDGASGYTLASYSPLATAPTISMATATTGTTDGLTVVWTAATPVAPALAVLGYIVEYREYSGVLTAEPSLDSTVNEGFEAVTVIIPGTLTTALTGLTPNTLYEIRVVAITPNGFGVYSRLFNGFGGINSQITSTGGVRTGALTPTGIKLTVSPTVVNEGAGDTPIVVTATATPANSLFTTDQTVTILVTDDTATSGTDYTAVSSVPALVIPMGVASGTTTFTLTPTDDTTDEDVKTIMVTGTHTAPAPLTVAGAVLSLGDNDATMTPTRPAAPALVMVTATPSTSDGLTVTWDNPASAGSSPISAWAVQYRLADTDGEYTTDGVAVNGVLDQRTATITGLAPNTGYQVRVAAISAAISVDRPPRFSVLAEGTTGTTNALEPAGIHLTLSPTSVGEGATSKPITVTATARPPGSLFKTAQTVTIEVFDSTSLGGDDFTATAPDDYTAVTGIPAITIPANAASATTTFTLTTPADLVAEGAKTIGVVGAYPADAGAEPDYDEIAYALLTLDDDDRAPGPPIDVQYRPMGGVTRAAVIGWDPPADPGTSPAVTYMVEYSPATPVAYITTDVVVDDVARTAIIPGLTPGTSYLARVTATSDAGMSEGVVVAFDAGARAPVGPAAPTSVTVTATPGTSDGLTITWTAPFSTTSNPITSYLVEYTCLDSVGCSAYSSAGVTVAAVPDSSATITGLVYNTLYFVRVAAVNDTGTGAYSRDSQGTTLDRSPPGAPAITSVTAVTVQAVQPDTDPPSNPPLPTIPIPGLTVAWDAPATLGLPPTITGYVVRYGNSSSGYTLEIVSPDPETLIIPRTLTVIDVTPGVAYEVRVAAANAGGTGAYSAPMSATIAAAPASAPGSIYLTVSQDSVSEGDAASIVVTATVIPIAFTTVQTVTISVSDGTAAAGTDYTAVTVPAIVIPANAASSSTTFMLMTTTDTTPESNETVTVSGTHGGSPALPIDPIEITILDDDPATGAPTAPTDVTVTLTANTPDSLTVTWGVPATTGDTAISGYVLQHRPSGGAWITRNIDLTNVEIDGMPIDAQSIIVDGLSIPIGGLTDRGSYEVRVAAVNDAGTGVFSASVTAGAVIGAPPAPTDVTVRPGAAGALTVTWSLAAGSGSSPISAYTVEYRTRGVGNFVSDGVTVGALLARSATITGLAPGTAYEVRVQAANTAGDGEYSEPTHVVIPQAPPSAPVRVSVTAVTGTTDTLAVTWDDGHELDAFSITAYTVQYRTDAGAFTTAVNSVNPDLNERSATLTGLTSNTVWEVRVSATNAAGESDYSTSAFGATLAAAGAPGAPTGVLAEPTAGTNDGLTVTWSAPADPGSTAITGYTVQYALFTIDRSAAFFSTGVTVAALAARSATITGLAPGGIVVKPNHLPPTAGVAYLVRVRALNAAGPGDFSEVSATTAFIAGAAPGVPTMVMVTAPTGAADSLTVTWVAAPVSAGDSPVTGYVVEHRRPAVNGVDSPYVNTALVDVAGLTATITDLAPGAAYQVRVRAFSLAGPGAFSEPVAGLTVTPVPAGAPGVPGTETDGRGWREHHHPDPGSGQ